MARALLCVAAVLPYCQQPNFDLGPIPIHAFGLLVFAAIAVGTELASRRARLAGIDPESMVSYATWLVVPGFLGAHVFDSIWYHPAEVLENPSTLLAVFSGMSSFGGFVGAAGGAIAWRFFKAEPMLPRVELVLSVFPISWTLGRAACTVAHDHPGLPTTATNPLAFAYPDGPRWDLGFLEMLFALGLSLVCARLWRRPQPLGTYTALVCLSYAPLRFGLDFLRAEAADGGDARYAGLTPAQWACFALAAVGLLALRTVRDERGRRRRSGGEEVEAPMA